MGDIVSWYHRPGLYWIEQNGVLGLPGSFSANKNPDFSLKHCQSSQPTQGYGIRECNIIKHKYGGPTSFYSIRFQGRPGIDTNALQVRFKPIHWLNIIDSLEDNLWTRAVQEKSLLLSFGEISTSLRSNLPVRMSNVGVALTQDEQGHMEYFILFSL